MRKASLNDLQLVDPQASAETIERPAHTREQELLLCCARTLIDSETAVRIRALLRQDIDWPYLVQTATDHQVMPLLCWNLCGTFSEACPTTVIGQFRSVLHGNAVRNIFLTSELVKLLKLFEVHNIPVIPYKGPVLATVIYGHNALRSFADLDILVHKWDYHFRVADLLASHGWQLTASYGWEMTFKDVTGIVQLDVHAGLTHDDMPVPLDFANVWERCATVSIGGKTVRSFAPLDLLLVLCVQLAKDAGATRAPQLIKVCDIAELVRKYDDVDWRRVTKEAKKLGTLQILFLGLLTADELIGIELPEYVRQKSRAFSQMAALVTHARQRVLGVENGYSRPELLDGSRWHSELRERIWERNTLVKQFFHAITPNIFDYSFVRLPRALFCLYPVVRPVRLIYKYGRKLLRLSRGKSWI